MVKKGRILTFFIIVVLLAGLIGATIIPIAKNIKLGLDLQGGFEILYKVEPAKKGDKITEDTLKSTVAALRNRVDALGVSETNIQIEGDDQIRVSLAGIDNQNDAREMLSTQAVLSFRDVNDNVKITGADLQAGKAKVAFEPNTNAPLVTLKLKDADLFGKVTKEIRDMPYPDNKLVIWLDYQEGDSYKAESTKAEPKYISAPQVTEIINSKDVQITGMDSVEEAQKLADLLNAGSLPVKLKEEYSNTVGAQFGIDSLKTTMIAGAIGIGIIFLFMLFYYRLPGMIAVITLSAYIYLILVIFDWMNGVLTLPGIAALILGVGMAVDANIITYERIKEELRAGKSVMSAFKAGNRGSITAIVDANLTTIIAGAVLFIFGTSSVKGFALILIISILASFVTAVYGTRLFLGLWVNSKALNKKPGYFGVKESEISEL